MSVSATTDIEVGDRVVDSNPNGAPSAMRVVDLPEEQANEFYIGAIGKTVAEVNDGHPPDDPVVGVAYENDLDRALDWWRIDVDEELQREFESEPEPKIDPGPDHLAAYATHDETGITVYHYPKSRLRSIDEGWGPPAGEDRSSGKREREETFGEHEGAVGSFITDLRKALSEPVEVAEVLLGMLTVGETAADVANADRVLMDITAPGANIVSPRSNAAAPRTRGECRHSRNDNYRPEDDDAMCCWECSNRTHNRPEKFKREDPAGSVCSRRGQSGWKLRESVMKGIDLSVLPDGFEETYDGDRRRLVRDITALRSGDEDRIRKAALRLAYRPHLGHVEEYNYSRAMALLRDRDAAGELPIIGDREGRGEQ